MMWADIVMFFAVPVIAFLILVVPAAVHLIVSRRKMAAKRQQGEPASPAKSRVSVEMQSIPLRDITTGDQQQQAKAKPYVAIPAPFRISTASSGSHSNIV